MKEVRISERRSEARSHSSDSRIVKIHTEGKGLGVLKTMLVAFLVLVQLAVTLLLYLGFYNAFRWYQLVAFILSLLSCLHVLSSKKTGQAKTVWVLFLVLFYAFGFIFYILSNEQIFFGLAKRRYRAIFERTAGYIPQYHEVKGVSETVSNDLKYLWSIGNFTAYSGKLKYFPSGARLFDDMLESLENAEKFIFIEYFIIADGVLFDRIFDVLEKKAQAGVDIRVIFDGVGSHGTLSLKNRRRMKKAGIKFLPFNRLIPRFTFALNLRDHRKIVVIDGKAAYTGGCNLADEYINEKRMHGYWKDCGIRIEGRAADGLTLTFLRQWEFLTKTREDYSPFLSVAEECESAPVVPYADGKDYECDVGKGVYEQIISGASKRLYIMTPYFVPDESTATLLAQKALSGVDVRLVLPGVPDKSYVYRVTVDNAERLISSGVKVYKMRNSFVHSKIVLSENCASVGSVNIDLRSYYNQFENGVYTSDEATVAEIESDFNSVFGLCEYVTKENSTRNSLFKRIIAGVLRVFAPLM